MGKRAGVAHIVYLALGQDFAFRLLEGRRPQRVEDAVGVAAGWAAAAAAAAAARAPAATAAAAGFCGPRGCCFGWPWGGTRPWGHRALLLRQRPAAAGAVHASSGQQNQERRHRPRL